MEVSEPEDLAGSQGSCPSPLTDLLSTCPTLVPMDHFESSDWWGMIVKKERTSANAWNVFILLALAPDYLSNSTILVSSGQEAKYVLF